MIRNRDEPSIKKRALIDLPLVVWAHDFGLDTLFFSEQISSL